MPAKIRLTRHGKKGRAFYHIVVADVRAPRDGRFVEKIGIYDPVTNPATIQLDTEKAFEWLKKGAQPTDTVRAILSHKGVMYRNHLAKGITKGALTQEQADAKFKTWLEEKENKIESKKSTIVSKNIELSKSRLAAESKVREEKAKAILAKRNAEEAKEVSPEATENEETQAPAENN